MKKIIKWKNQKVVTNALDIIIQTHQSAVCKMCKEAQLKGNLKEEISCQLHSKSTNALNLKAGQKYNTRPRISQSCPSFLNFGQTYQNVKLLKEFMSTFIYTPIV